MIEKYIALPQQIHLPDYNEINNLLNAQDAFFTLSGSEGHGLPVSESMHLGKPIIYGVYGGHTTFCRGCGLEIPVTNFVSSNNIDARKAIHNTDKAAEAIYTLYKDKKICDDLGKKGEEKAKELGSEVSIISTDTREGVQLKDMGGVAAILRYEVEQ